MAGIPQGSILGPVLFNIFVNDLAYVIKRSNLSTYADDTQIFYADKDPVKIQDNINSDLSFVDKWHLDNGMKRNHSKYQAIVMGKTQGKPKFCSENTVIPNNDSFEMLGVTMDETLKFDKHVAKICRKVSQQIASVKRMRNILPYEIRKSIYLLFISPYFNYCAQTWRFCNKNAAAKLEKFN